MNAVYDPSETSGNRNARLRAIALLSARRSIARGLVAAAVLETGEQPRDEKEARALANRFFDRAELIAADLATWASRLLEAPAPIGVCSSRACRDRLAQLVRRREGAA